MKKTQRKKSAAGNRSQEINEFLRIVNRDGRSVVQCMCGHDICSAKENFKRHLRVSSWQMSRISPIAEQITVPEKFVFREFYCPGCYLLLETEVALKDEPIRWDVKLD